MSHIFSGHGGNIAQVCETYGLRPDGIIDFSANINPLGYPPDLPDRITREFQSVLHYPDINASPLRSSIAREIGLKQEEVLVGNGSTEFIYLIPRVLGPKGGVVFEPAYSDYARALGNSGAEVKEILCEEDAFRCDLNHHDLNSIGAEGDRRVLYLCNPNNPTGYLTRREDILSLAGRFPAMYIVVDEAFMDFVGAPGAFSVLPDVGRVRNVIVLRSMTKFFGIPGLRLGYAAAHREVVEGLQARKEPWTVNALAQVAGLVALENKRHINESREFVSAEKEFLYRQLSETEGLKPLRPAVNFILVKITGEELTARELQDSLIKMGILIRDCSNFKGLGDRYFRVAVRNHEENLRLLSCLESALKGLTVG
ncbi:MAG: threonine-phosphate decarboxylase CobD [Candidatus Brocadiales bacterium]